MLSARLQNTPCTSGGRSSPNSACGRSSAMPNGPSRQDALADEAGVGEGRQQQRVGPDQRCRRSCRRCAPRAVPRAPEQAAEEGRRELRDRGERRAGRSRRAARRRPSGSRDRRAAGSTKIAMRRTVSSSAPTSLAAGEQRLAPLQHQRHDDVVRHHDRERDRSPRSPWRSRPTGRRRRRRASSSSEPAESGSASTNMSLSTLPGGKVSRPASAIGTTNRLISTR